MDDRAIGIFDSGLGGLTAAHELISLMPDEHIIYLGDSANMPYGEKTHEQIVEMSRMDMRFLLDRGVKVIFVACGTATSNALDILRQECPVPVFGVVEAAVDEAIYSTKNNRVGLLATTASVNAGTFEKFLKTRDPNLFVKSRACPKFASMVEDGVFDKEDARVQAAAEEYLPCLKEANVDTVILGCTHYPLLTDIITEYMGSDVKLISSGAAAARALARFLRNNGMENINGGKAEYYTTGEASAFANTAYLMLRNDIRSALTEIQSPLTKRL